MKQIKTIYCRKPFLCLKYIRDEEEWHQIIYNKDGVISVIDNYIGESEPYEEFNILIKTLNYGDVSIFDLNPILISLMEQLLKKLKGEK